MNVNGEGCADARMVRQESIEEHWKWPAGHFAWGKDNNARMLYLALPAEHAFSTPEVPRASWCIIPVRQEHEANIDSGWLWDGNIESPTLQQSVKHCDPGQPGYWHGWIRDGVMLGC